MIDRVLVRFWELRLSKTLSVSESDQLLLRKQSSKQLTDLISMQAFLVLTVSLLAWVLFDWMTSLSVFIGGMVYLVPSALVVLNIVIKLHLGRSGMMSVFFAELFKIALTLGLMALVVLKAGDHIVWPAFVIGLIIVLKGYLLVLFRPRHF